MVMILEFDLAQNIYNPMSSLAFRFLGDRKFSTFLNDRQVSFLESLVLAPFRSAVDEVTVDLVKGGLSLRLLHVVSEPLSFVRFFNVYFVGLTLKKNSVHNPLLCYRLHRQSRQSGLPSPTSILIPRIHAFNPQLAFLTVKHQIPLFPLQPHQNHPHQPTLGHRL
ncbi:hypothetical protein BC829DRAFT_393169 [Chytridium lagenaria]|nr:hypothetical protein BC829DRAFT_393169 [Chytridium lagenaria]